RLRVISPDGTVRTVAGVSDGLTNSGDGGPATRAHVYPRAVAVDSSDNIYIADPVFGVRKISGGVITTIANYLLPNAHVPPFDPDGGIAVDTAGHLYYSDPYVGRVRMLSTGSSTTPSVLAVTPNKSPVGQAYTVSYTVTSGAGPPAGTVS